ncbi:MAG TPA: FHA domain-containing protein [Ghiorsea sp.]|nr:FHA domain-containing protein [Ghiorsea sp.]HIP07262.1 FHA domain-containing protein [Mariprofundaceae bacterium]
MSCKLVLKFKDTVISEYDLNQEETTIGRKEENEIHVDNLAVSSRHARILKIGNKVILEDLGSTNGTQVNDRDVTKHVLNHGDIITVGKHTLTFICANAPAAQQSEESDMDKTMIISSADREEMMGKAGAPPASEMMLGGVQYLSGPLMGKSMELKASLTSMGKGSNCRIKVKGLLVGKQAAVFTRRPTGYHLTHLEGMSKTKVNGESISDHPRVLKDGDIIELSDIKMQFFIKK